MADDRDLFRAAFEASAFPMMITGADEQPGAYRHLIMPISPRHY